MVNHVPTLYIDNHPFPPFAYMSYLGEEKFYREAASSGIHLFNIPAYLGDRGINSTSGIGTFRPSIWVGEDQFDFSSIIKDFDEIIKSDSLAKVIIRIHLDPPEWWEKKHPQPASLLPDGSTYRHSFFSDLWQLEAGNALRQCVSWLLNSPYATRLAGIHVAGGFTEEWFYHYKDEFYDENPVRVQSFQEWLRNKYSGSNSKLKQAWENDEVSFSTAIPADISGKMRREGWRNPNEEKQIFDTFDFQAETMADHVAYFCHIVKNASKGRLLTGAFYGYHYFVTDPRRGHGALAKLLQCKDLDYLSSPNDYNRVVGEDWAPMAAISSIQRHGKLWLAENDTRTSITTLLKDRAPQIDPPGDYYSGGVWLGPKSKKTSVSLLWKNLARMLSYSYGGWWFDMWGGWFSDPDFLVVLEKSVMLYKEYAEVEVTGMKAEVGVVVDERLQFWDATYGSLTGRILNNRYALAKTGATYDLFLRTDLDALAGSGFKIVWLMGIQEPSEQEWELISDLRKEGVEILWMDGKGTHLYSPEGKDHYLPGKLTWTARELGERWERAGVHRYIDTDDVLYAGNGWLSIHSLEGGKRQIKLPFKAKVMDVIHQDWVIDVPDDKIEIKLAPKSTSLFRLFPIEENK